MEHEGQRVANPQISLAFIRRGVDAQAALASTLGLPLPPAVADVAAHLAPLNTAVAPTPTPAGNWSAPLANTRCHADRDDWGWPSTPTLAACEAACAAQAGCALVTLCPPPDAPLPVGGRFEGWALGG